ncbi:MAG: tryptophan 7-halogenase [Woeseiaceae bacterium]
MSSPIRKVVIVGRDAAAWLSALALQTSFSKIEDGVAVELIELPSALGPQDAYVTLPPQHAFHDLLGLDENRLLRACAGLYVLGQRFSNWSGAAPPFLHAYDTHGVSLNQVDFLQFWLKARAAGLKVPLEDFSLGAVAAKQGRFVIFNDATRSFSNAAYGYHLDAIRYLRAIGRTALQAGLKHTVAEVTAVEHEGDRIRSLTLHDDSVVEGDLFIDASGPEARLIRHLERNNWESWAQWLPCDRALVASARALEPAPAFAQISAFSGGWLGIHPLMDRTALVAAYSSPHIKNDDLPEIVAALSGLTLDGDVVLSASAPGTRRAHWIGNCVAMGETGVYLEPLDGVQLHMLHTGLSHLVSLFPVDRDDMKEARVYNDKMAAHAVGLRDFQIAHYHLNRRFDDPFWNEVRAQEVPETLAEKLDLFGRRGIVAMREHETFHEENWTAILIGHGLIPATWDPLADNVPEQEQIANFQRMLKFIADEVESMPSLQAHVEMNAPATSDYIF